MSQSRAWRLYLSVPFNVWTIGFVTFLKNSSSVVLVVFCPVYLTDVLGVHMASLGALEGILESFSFFSRIASGAVSDLIGKRKPVLLAGYGLSLVGRFVLAFSSSLWGVLSARSCERLGNGIQASPRDALVGDFTTPKNRGASFGLRNSLTVLGSIFGALASMYFMRWTDNNYRMLFSATVIPSLLSIVLLIWFVEDAKRPKREKNKMLSKHFLEDVCALSGRFWVLGGIGFFLMLSNFSLMFFIMLAKDLGLPTAATPTIMIMQGFANALVAFPMGRLADKISKKHALQVGIVLLFLANIGFMSSTFWHQSSGYGLVIVFVCICLWGAQMAVIQNTALAMVTGVTPQKTRGTAFGIMYLLNGFGTLLANSIGGYVWQYYNAPQATFLMGAVISCAGFFAASYFLSSKDY